MKSNTLSEPPTPSNLGAGSSLTSMACSDDKNSKIGESNKFKYEPNSLYYEKNLVQWDSLTKKAVTRVEAPEGGGRPFLEELGSLSSETQIDRYLNNPAGIFDRPTLQLDGLFDEHDYYSDDSVTSSATPLLCQMGGTIRYMLYRSWRRNFYGAAKKPLSRLSFWSVAAYSNLMMLTFIYTGCQYVFLHMDEDVRGTLLETVNESFLKTGLFYGLAYIVWLLVAFAFLKERHIDFYRPVHIINRVLLVIHVILCLAIGLNAHLNMDLTPTTTLLGQSCESSLNAYNMCIHWYPLSHAVFMHLFFICLFLYRTIYHRLCKYYLLQSSFLVKSYVCERVEQIRLKIPEGNKFKEVDGILMVGFNFDSFIEILRQRKCSPDLSKVKHRRYIHFIGQVDDQGRPHGYGYWKDLGGERLTGYWRHGRPIGPYQARVLDDGSGFTAIKLGYYRYDHVKDDITIGIAHVEASVTGKFYMGFPKIHLIRAPEPASDYLKRNANRFDFFKDNMKQLILRRKSHERQPSYDKIMKTVNKNQKNKLKHNMTNSMALTKRPNDSSIEKISKGGYLKKSSKVGASVRESASSVYYRNLSTQDMTKTIIATKIDLGTGFSGLQPESLAKTSHAHEDVAYYDSSDDSSISSSAHAISSNPILSLNELESIGNGLDENHHNDNRAELEGLMVASYQMNWTMKQLRISSCTEENNDILNIHFDKRSGTFDVGGYNYKSSELRLKSTYDAGANKNVQYKMHIDLHKKKSTNTTEVMVYIHGFNNTIEDSGKMLGQLAAYGNFAADIKLLIFSWPSAQSAGGFFYAQKQCDNPQNHRAFADFIVMLKRSGATDINFLCHSMGARFLMNSIKALYKYKIFHDADSSDFGVCPKKISIHTVTFVSPFQYLKDWLENDFHHLRRKTPMITIYADAHDKAIGMGQLFSQKKKVLGKYPLGNYLIHDKHVVRPAHLIAEDPDATYTKCMETYVDAELENWKWGDQGPKVLQNCGGWEYSKCCKNVPVKKHRASRLGRSVPPSDEVRWLDLDIIDTSFVDGNMESKRHTFFAVNRDVIEDLRELICFKRRARYRVSRLDRRLGNVYTFRIAPGFVTAGQLDT